MVNRFAAAGAPPHIAHALLRSGLSIGTLRSMSPLPENAQKLIDTAVVKVGLERLVFVADLLSAGLTYPITDPLGIMEIQWEQISKAGGAQRTMTPSARGENQLPDRAIKRIPVYLTTDDFSLSIRSLHVSQRAGVPLDTTLVMEATRRVNEAIEDAAINGAGLTSNGYDTPGLLTAPNKVTFSFSSNEEWTNVAHDGSDILSDVLGAIGLLQAKHRYGPYNLYVPTAYGIKLMEDFKANGSLSIMQRLSETQAGGRAINVRVADRMPAGYVALVQMTSDVVDVITGQSPTVIPWTSVDGFTLFWMVMAIMVPRFRDDYEGNSGIAIGKAAAW